MVLWCISLCQVSTVYVKSLLHNEELKEDHVWPWAAHAARGTVQGGCRPDFRLATPMVGTHELPAELQSRVEACKTLGCNICPPRMARMPAWTVPPREWKLCV